MQRVERLCQFKDGSVRISTRLLQSSSPNVKVGGIPYGNPTDHPQAAYNVEMLCRSAPITAKFR
jgi:hypothetical protein